MDRAAERARCRARPRATPRPAPAKNSCGPRGRRATRPAAASSSGSAPVYMVRSAKLAGRVAEDPPIPREEQRVDRPRGQRRLRPRGVDRLMDGLEQRQQHHRRQPRAEHGGRDAQQQPAPELAACRAGADQPVDHPRRRRQRHDQAALRLTAEEGDAEPEAQQRRVAGRPPLAQPVGRERTATAARRRRWRAGAGARSRDSAAKPYDTPPSSAGPRRSASARASR